MIECSLSLKCTATRMQGNEYVQGEMSKQCQNTNNKKNTGNAKLNKNK